MEVLQLLRLEVLLVECLFWGVVRNLLDNTTLFFYFLVAFFGEIVRVFGPGNKLVKKVDRHHDFVEEVRLNDEL